MKHHRYLIACVLPFLFSYSVFGDKSIQQHLTEGNNYLTTGQFSNALHSFDAAIRKYFVFLLIETVGLIRGYSPGT
jgi:DnaJ family protein C protein 3